MAKPLRPFVRGGGYYPSKKWIPLVRNGGYTTQNGGETEPVWATASGAIASFTTPLAYPLKKLVAQINPVQDLHGQPNPYPAGGGKNKINEDTVWASFLQSDGSFLGRGGDVSPIKYYIPSELVGTQLTFSAYIKKPSGSSISNIRVEATAGGSSNIGNVVNSESYTLSKVTFTPTATSDYVRIAYGDGSTENLQFKDVQLETGSSATSFAPYTNLCPISGWTGLKGQRTGFNVWDEEWELANINWSTYVFTPTTSGGRLASKNYIPVVEGNYYCNFNRSNTVLVGYTDDNGNGGRELTVDFNTNIVAIPSDVHFIKFGIATSYYGTTYNHDISINYPSTDTSYHAYQGKPFSVSWQDEAGTVYKGTVDPVTGVLIATHKMVTLVGANTEAWGNTYSTAYGAFSITLSDANINGIPSQQLLSNQFLGHEARGAMQSWSVGKLLTYNQVSDNKYVFFTTDITDKTQWLAWLANNPTQLLYPLAQPQTYQLTPQEVDTLVGQNNIWTTTGDVEVTYRIE